MYMLAEIICYVLICNADVIKKPLQATFRLTRVSGFQNYERNLIKVIGVSFTSIGNLLVLFHTGRCRVIHKFRHCRGVGTGREDGKKMKFGVIFKS